MTSVRAIVYGRNKADLLPLLDEMGIEVVEERPDVLVTYGGDGTLLGAELDWPGVPKLALRDSRRCRTCSHHSNDVILRHLAEGKLKETKFIKLYAEVGDRHLTGINDIVINKAGVNAGLRFKLTIDDEPYADDEVVGDGLVVSTPFGSAAYYRSITNSTFRVGIGIAFNNSTEPISHLVVGEDSIMRVRVTRGPALVAADNNPDLLQLEEDDEAIIRRADDCAVILAYDRMKYPADQFIY